MDAGITPFRSILDKPLKDLTEEDISQLTREDCRNFLKQKGMRRPSWNKSQAIQQVISLKALLETTDDSGASALRKIVVSRSENPPKGVSHSADSAKEASPAANTALPADEPTPYRRKDPPKSSPPREIGCRPADPDTGAISPNPRSPCETDEQVGQMTIFYCGKVNVYDAILPDKAHAIMQLAASPVHFSRDDPFNGNVAVWSFPCNMQTVSESNGPAPAGATVSQPMQADVEGQPSRKVSVQRYLEKRKDRGRFKIRKDAGYNSSSLEMCLNPQVRMPVSNGQLSRSNTSSPTQPGMPNLLYNSAENQEKIVGFSVDLNDKDAEDQH